MGTITKLPITKANKYRKRMADQLREYADMIEHEGAEPAIDTFVIAIKQDKRFAVGGCGTLTRHEQRKLWIEFRDFINKLGS